MTHFHIREMRLMEEQSTRKIVRVVQGQSEHAERRVVTEYPLRLRVNGRDLATLVCSPHQLNFLLAGFFLLQGFINNLDDILFEQIQVEIATWGR